MQRNVYMCAFMLNPIYRHTETEMFVDQMIMCRAITQKHAHAHLGRLNTYAISLCLFSFIFKCSCSPGQVMLEKEILNKTELKVLLSILLNKRYDQNRSNVQN